MILLASIVGAYVLFTQVSPLRDFVAGFQTPNFSGNNLDQLSPEEKLAQEKQALAEQQAYLNWKKSCAAQGIDDFRCESLWKEQQAINDAKRELDLQQAAINEQKRLEAEQEAAAEAQAAAREAARLEQLEREQEALKQKQLAEQEAARQAYLKALATPKVGYIEITAATLDPSGISTVTIHNLLPNTCYGANWCDIVVIDSIYVNGEKTEWKRASQNFVILAGQSGKGVEWSYTTMPFVNESHDSGTIRIEGYSKDDSQRIFAEFLIQE